MEEMTYKQFILLAEQFISKETHIPFKIYVYKEKAGYLMITFEVNGNDYGSGSIIGPDAGYANQADFWGFSLDGWAYLYKDNQWRIIQDGVFCWRHAKTAPINIEQTNIKVY